MTPGHEKWFWLIGKCRVCTNEDIGIFNWILKMGVRVVIFVENFYFQRSYIFFKNRRIQKSYTAPRQTIASLRKLNLKMCKSQCMHIRRFYTFEICISAYQCIYADLCIFADWPELLLHFLHIYIHAYNFWKFAWSFFETKVYQILVCFFLFKLFMKVQYCCDNWLIFHPVQTSVLPITSQDTFSCYY